MIGLQIGKIALNVFLLALNEGAFQHITFEKGGTDTVKKETCAIAMALKNCHENVALYSLNVQLHFFHHE